MSVIKPIYIVGAVLMSFGFSPARAFDIVDGAACAHLALQIEDLGRQNEEILSRISEAQIEATGKGAADKSALLAAQHEAYVTLRQTWISEYSAKCASASMSVGDLRRICKPAGGNFQFYDTAFCKPFRDSGQ